MLATHDKFWIIPRTTQKGLKVTLLQGVIGAASLAGTTAIPLVVQKFLMPPAPVNSPTPVPSQVTPSPQVQPTLGGASEPNASKVHDDEEEGKHHGKGKGKKGKKDD